MQDSMCWWERDYASLCSFVAWGRETPCVIRCERGEDTEMCLWSVICVWHQRETETKLGDCTTGGACMQMLQRRARRKDPNNSYLLRTDWAGPGPTAWIGPLGSAAATARPWRSRWDLPVTSLSLARHASIGPPWTTCVSPCVPRRPPVNCVLCPPALRCSGQRHGWSVRPLHSLRWMAMWCACECALCMSIGWMDAEGYGERITARACLLASTSCSHLCGSNF
jgi:hypothetical protein